MKKTGRFSGRVHINYAAGAINNTLKVDYHMTLYWLLFNLLRHQTLKCEETAYKNQTTDITRTWH